MVQKRGHLQLDPHPNLKLGIITGGRSHQRRDLFTECTLAFFGTTSLYFEGQGGESLGQFGYSKDHRPDRRQIIVGAGLTGEGRPVCCELWPGNQADAHALLPVVARVRQRFGLSRVCWVADRGMISADTIRELEDQGLEYILGARLRQQREVRGLVLGCPRPLSPSGGQPPSKGGLG